VLDDLRMKTPLLLLLKVIVWQQQWLIKTAMLGAAVVASSQRSQVPQARSPSA